MTTMIRRNARRGAVVLGSLAVVLGAASCGGSSDDAAAPEEKTTEAASAAEDAGDDAATAEDSAAEDSASDEGGAASEDASDDAAASGPLSDEDLSAASTAFIDFMSKAADGDGEGACALMVDPTTGDAMTGSNLETCGSTFEGQLGDSIDPSMKSMFTEENVKAEDNGDGSAKIVFMGTEMPNFSIVKGKSGDWLIDSGVSAG